MCSLREYKRKIREKSYTISEIEDGFQFENQYHLFDLMKEIASERLVTDKIIQNLQILAEGKSAISQKGVGNFSVQVVAYATLNKLGYTQNPFEISQDVQQWVLALENDKFWKEL